MNNYQKGIKISNDFFNGTKKIYNFKFKNIIIKSVFYLILIKLEIEKE